MSINILDVFGGNAFGVDSLTQVVNDFTPVYTYLNAIGLFNAEGVMQRTAVVDFDVTTSQLLPSTAWGGPGVANRTGHSRSRSYSIPHFPILDTVLASDLQGRRRPGSDAVQDAQWVLAKKMMEMRRKLDQTDEWLKLGVLKSGQIKDGLGNLILDIYADFGISQTSTSFVLGTTTTDIMGKIATVKRNILAALRGEVARQFVVFASDTFYDAFVSHPNVKVAFQYFQNNTNQNLAIDYSGGENLPDNQAQFNKVAGFVFGNTLWINYTGAVTDSSGATQQMIDAGSAYMVPLGTTVFREWYAPADYMETVNTEGLPFYAKQRLTNFDKGIEVECQSNPLPICLKPLVIQKLTIS